MRSFAIALATLLAAPLGAQAFDEAQYPDLHGEWTRVSVSGGVGRVIQFDQTKPPGLAQQAPLKPEFQKIFEANIADQAKGGQAGDPTFRCLSPGMPRSMSAYTPMEVVVTPQTTYILIDHIHDNRRIHTDGRDFPAHMEDDPQYNGYSIGRWVDEDGDGRYDALIVETRGMKGPRAFEADGIPLHPDNRTVVRERIYLDKNNPNLLHDDITTIDNALTHPWSVVKTYRRTPPGPPIWWHEDVCSENNVHVDIGNEVYYLSADGLLMPAKPGQAPPDLRYFNRGVR